METRRFDTEISIVLPAYDEVESIEEAVRACLAVLDETFRGGEVVVVDDGSKDGTAELLRRLADEDPRVKVVAHERNRGYGRAIRSGFEAARSPLVFFTDADVQFDVRELAAFVPLMDEADVVLGFRVYRFDSVMRCILSWVYNRIVRVLFRVRVRDVDCSFKLFRKEVVDHLALECEDFFIDTEIVARCSRMGVRIVEKGVRHYPRQAGRTTVRPSHVPKTLWTVARMWFRIHFGRSSQPRLRS